MGHKNLNKYAKRAMAPLKLMPLITASYCSQSLDRENIHQNGSLVFAIDGIDQSVKDIKPSYRIYCAANAGAVSELLTKGTPTATAADSSGTGTQVSFDSDEAKKVADGSTCVMDVYSDNQEIAKKYNWLYTKKGGSEKQVGLFYMSESTTVTARKASLKIFATFNDPQKSFKLTVSATYPNDRPKTGNLTDVFLLCGTNKTRYLASDFGTLGATVSHVFDLDKEKFKTEDTTCDLQATVSSSPAVTFKSESSITIVKNEQGAAVQANATMVVGKLDPPPAAGGSGSTSIIVDVTVSNESCKVVAGIPGCSPTLKNYPANEKWKSLSGTYEGCSRSTNSPGSRKISYKFSGNNLETTVLGYFTTTDCSGNADAANAFGSSQFTVLGLNRPDGFDAIKFGGIYRLAKLDGTTLSISDETTQDRPDANVTVKREIKLILK